MLSQGPLPVALHGVLEYLAGGLLIAAPFLLDFEAGAAIAASIVTGLIVLFLAATTSGPTSLVNQIPVPAHVVADYVLAAVLVAAPFIFAFSGETAPTAFFIGLGVAHLLVTVATRFVKARGGESPVAGP